LLEKVQVYLEGKRYPDAAAFVPAAHGLAKSASLEALPEQSGPSSGLNFLSALRGEHKERLIFSNNEGD